jgi:Uma2 family endonuclease
MLQLLIKTNSIKKCFGVNGEYETQELRGNQIIISQTFPDLQLTAEQVLGAGR